MRDSHLTLEVVEAGWFNTCSGERAMPEILWVSGLQSDFQRFMMQFPTRLYFVAAAGVRVSPKERQGKTVGEPAPYWAWSGLLRHTKGTDTRP